MVVFVNKDYIKKNITITIIKKLDSIFLILLTPIKKIFQDNFIVFY